jgi:hypothetical protein
MTTGAYYRERRKMQEQALVQKQKKLLTDEYTDFLCYKCDDCTLKDRCEFGMMPAFDGKTPGCEFRRMRFLEKFAEMTQTGDENIDRAHKLLARMEVEMDLHLIKSGGDLNKSSIAITRTLVHGYLRVQEALKGRTVNINRTDLLSINTPEVEALERKLEKLKKWEALQAETSQEATQS